MNKQTVDNDTDTRGPDRLSAKETNDAEIFLKVPEGLHVGGKNWSQLAPLVIALVFLVLFTASIAFSPGENTILAVRETKKDGPEWRRPPVPENPFEKLVLEAKGAVVMDVQNEKILFEKNSQKQLPLASLTKIMVALAALERVPDATTVMIEPEYLTNVGDTGLLAGERWRLEDILQFTLVTSSNDGASAVATVAGALGKPFDEGVVHKATFVGIMNEMARRIGLEKTYFLNETGLDTNDIINGAYGTASDVAALFIYALREAPDIFEATRYSTLAVDSLTGVTHTLTNTNTLIDKLPGLIASKTGYTDLSGGNLAIVFEAGPAKPFVVVVLGSSRESRFSDVEQLVWATLDYLKKY